MRRIALLLALLTALGPASLRWLHESTAHAHEAPAPRLETTHAHDCDGHQHDDERPAPDHEDGCAVCDALGGLNASGDFGATPSLPTPRAACATTPPAVAPRPAPLAALRAMPPPRT